MTLPGVTRVINRLSYYQTVVADRISGQIGVSYVSLRTTLERLFPPEDPPAFRLAIADVAPSHGEDWQRPPLDPTSRREGGPFLGPLSSLLEPFTWAVPKKGRTPYTVRKRWYNMSENTKMAKYGRPLLNVTHCLECNNLTLPNCVCPHCYEKVRERTNELKAKLDEDFKYRYPAKEIKFVYDNEHFGIENSKHAVKMEGERPSWFSKAVLPRKGK